jgi:hypothetical protein
MGRSFPVKTRLLLAAALLLHPGAANAARDPAPDAHAILQTVRIAQSSQNQTMRGRLRMGPKSIPFRLVLSGGTIRYEFSDPEQTLILRLQERDSRLEEVTDAGSQRVTPARFDTKVRNSDISYEDLALRFLYWPTASVEGEQTMLLRKCWKIRVEPGRGASQYGRATLWVDKESGALMQAEAFDQAGNFARRFKVISGQKIGGMWMLKQMRIEAPSGGKSKDRTPTYLEVQGVE